MEDNNRITGEVQHDKDPTHEAIMVDPLAVRIGETEAERLPKVGMEFDSYEDVVNLYNDYARRIGFGTKTRSSEMRNGIFTFLLTCDKNGQPRGKKRPAPKTGCKACLRGRQMIDGRYCLTTVMLDHNHLLTPSKIESFRSHRKLTENVKRQLEFNDMAGIPVCKSIAAIAAQLGGYENLGATKRDCRNYVDKVRRLRRLGLFDKIGETKTKTKTRNHIDKSRRLKLGEGDAEAINQYFLRMENKDSNFFYVMDLDDDGRLRNVFWFDGRSKAAYKYFDDVISFDTTYLTNKYDLPLALFVGVNHHGNSVLLGCGLLADESIDTYVWLFKSWLSCMSGHPPKAIVTDQCKSIQAAVAKVFSEARHRLCLCHIMKKLPEKFGGHNNYFAIKGTFKKAVYGSLRVSEFEDAWQNMVSNFGLDDNEWLASLYEIRDRWVPVYLNDTFWAGMCAAQRSEGMNAYFDDYVNATTSLKQFFGQYEKALQSKYEKEAAADFNSFHKMPQIKTDWQMEVQLSKIYTIDMFNQFQDQLKNVLNCHTSPIVVYDGMYIFDVKEFVDIGNGDIMTKVFEVVLKAPALEVRCNCRSFESRGILCCHALSALHNRGVFEIPDKYIIPRWRKDYKRLHMLASSKSPTCAIFNNTEERYDDIYKCCHQLAEIGTMSEHNYERAIKMIEAIEKRLVEEEDEQPAIEISVMKETSKVSGRQREVGEESNNVSQFSLASPLFHTQLVTKESMNLMAGEVPTMEEEEEEEVRERRRARLLQFNEENTVAGCSLTGPDMMISSSMQRRGPGYRFDL